jgi:hypothetical protein
MGLTGRHLNREVIARIAALHQAVTGLDQRLANPT